MAVAGLHNVSVLEPAFMGEVQSESVRRHRGGGGGGGGGGRVGTRASSLLQMWRELEDEHVVGQRRVGGSGRLVQHRSDEFSVDASRTDASDTQSNANSGTWDDTSENEYGQWSPGLIGSENGGQDENSDLGEIERERVRQIFREWRTSGVRERASNTSRRDNGSRAEWLGETEQERVRIIREWVQMNTRQRGVCVDRGVEQGGEVVGQIEQVLDGLIVNHNDGRTRSIRRLCGRQALLDMLKKAERERQSELQDLVEHRAVSQFAHRNRIQSLLKGRFLRDNRVVKDESPSSSAASELGLLRQRHTVSGLREGFLSRLDQSNCGDTSSNSSDTSSVIDVTNASELIQGNDVESGNTGPSGDRNETETYVVENTSRQPSVAIVEERSLHVLEDEVSNRQQPSMVDFVDRRDTSGEVVNGLQQEFPDEPSPQLVEDTAGDHINSLSPSEVLTQESRADQDERASHMLSSNVVDLQVNVLDNASHHESTEQLDLWPNQVLESRESSSFEADQEPQQDQVGIQDNADGDHHETITGDWLENDDREEASEAWHEDGGFQEAVQSWLEEPSDQSSAPVGRMDPFYISDNDNVYSMELRELLSRRSVSRLLRSGFRQSLDQLIQSYVERQTSAPPDWESEEPAPAVADQDMAGQPGRDQNSGLRTGVPSPPPLPPSLPPVQRFWDQDSHHYGWPQHDMNQDFGIEWDIINDLRIDMARLQQKMSNMQRMLETCMDMQLELQRSIRQEVSAALNRSAGSQEVGESNLLEDRSKWDHVKKGICCICGDASINSLLYRCGHMCTCSKCANELVKNGDKCPMCKAPVIEVIRAYSIM